MKKQLNNPSRNVRRKLSFVPVFAVIFSAFVSILPAYAGNFIISNPYENVNWNTFSQFRAGLHFHTTRSDGEHSVRRMLDEHYYRGFNIVAVTDHNRWYEGGYTHRGMLVLPNTDEQLHIGHINTFFAPRFSANRYVSRETMLLLTEIYHGGGVAHLNHPGRYMGRTTQYSHGAEGVYDANHPANVQRYVGLFARFDAAIGMEIVNSLDRYSTDRIFWDNILTELMPFSHNVWAFGSDDAHNIYGVGFAWNTLLMPELTLAATRTAMETGAFYVVSRIDRRENINAILACGTPMPNHSRGLTAAVHDSLRRVLYQGEPPSIINIVAENDMISITGKNYHTIEWIADGVKIATGNTLDLNLHQSNINSHVRAQLRSDIGIAYTQAFGISRADVQIPEMFIYTVNIVGWQVSRPDRPDDIEPTRYFTLTDINTGEILVPAGNFRQARGYSAGVRQGFRYIRNPDDAEGSIRNYWWTATFVSSSDNISARLSPTEGRTTAFNGDFVLTADFSTAYIFFGNVEGVLYATPRANNTVDFTLISALPSTSRFDVTGSFSNWNHAATRPDVELRLQSNASNLIETLTPSGSSSVNRNVWSATTNARPGIHNFQLRHNLNWLSARGVHNAPLYITPNHRR